MVTQLVEDEFGLFHAAVPHPRMRRNVQVMVLKSEGGWWAYVDGERLGETFSTQHKAARAASQTIARLPAPATHAAHPIQIERPRYRRSKRVAAVASYLVLLAVTGGAAVHALSGLDSTPQVTTSALPQEPHFFAPTAVAPKQIAALDADRADYNTKLDAVAIKAAEPAKITATRFGMPPIQADPVATVTAAPKIKPGYTQSFAIPLPEKNTFKASGATIQLVSAVQADEEPQEEIAIPAQPAASKYPAPRRGKSRSNRRTVKRVRRVRTARRLAKLQRLRRGLGYKQRKHIRKRRHRSKAYRKAYARNE